MQLEDYFIFLSTDDIRIKGHRIGIDNILFYFLEGYSPEEIKSIYPDLSLEKIYATITYYFHNKKVNCFQLSKFNSSYSQWLLRWISDEFKTK